MNLRNCFKHRFSAAVAFLILMSAGAPLAANASYVRAGCAEQIESLTRLENQASNESDAGDYIAAYTDYQQAAIYRANCVDDTSGVAQSWNKFFEGMDYFGLALQALRSESWNDEAPGYHSKAHQLANELLSEQLPSELKLLAQTLWNDTQGD